MMPHLPRALLMCLLLGALLTACGKDEAAKPGGPGGRGGGPVPVVVETVAAQEWTDALRALGTVHAREAVTITAKVSETVQQVHFESGQQVARGAPLVTLSGQQQQAALASAEAALGEAEQLFLRQQQLVEQQLIARAALDAQRATQAEKLSDKTQPVGPGDPRAVRRRARDPPGQPGRAGYPGHADRHPR